MRERKHVLNRFEMVRRNRLNFWVLCETQTRGKEATIEIERGAEFSKCGKYRYRLWRVWGKEPCLCWLMLNPSRATATDDDPTIRRCMDFAQRWGFGGIHVVNLFALVTPHPAVLKKNGKRVGRRNDLVIQRYAGWPIVVAWGDQRFARPRARQVLSLLHGARLFCLGTTKDGNPRHPARLSRDARLVRFHPARFDITDSD